MKEVVFRQSAAEVDTYDFVEVSVEVASPATANPFIDVRIEGSFAPEGGPPVRVEGFCDSADGALHKIRFMPSKPGKYEYSVVYRDVAGQEARHEGRFEAVDGGRRGCLKVDPEHRWHFLWEGTGEHYFWNGTTTYYLMAWRDDGVIRSCIDRLSSLGVNRLRVLVYGRNDDRPWGMPIVNNEAFAMKLNPWVARWPDDLANPEFDLTRFNVDFWRKYERMLAHARERDVIVSVIPYVGAQILPVPFLEYSEDEKRYYRYAANRLAAYSNVTWDLGNEHDFHRNTRWWPGEMAPFMKRCDPYGHLVSLHNKVYRGQWWIDMQLIQRWDAGQNEFLVKQRAEQAASGRVVPQVIEEYGYEDIWEKMPGHRTSDTRRRCAWEIYMAGCHQTTGESARQGTGVPPDSGGGWVSGRGDDSMTMLEGYQHITAFFTSFEWWKAEPRNELVERYEHPEPVDAPHYGNDGKQVTDWRALCLAEPGAAYALYVPVGGSATVKLEPGTYSVARLNARTGERKDLSDADGPTWTSPAAPDGGDWAYLLRGK